MPPDDSQRYSRQIQLPEINVQGQEKLAGSTVLIAGAGGLGSLSALYLTATGVGHVIIVDHDQVELSNLNRQLLHRESSIGRPKALSAAESLGRLNSSIQITPVQATLDQGNIDDLLKGVDLIVDGCDNFKTRQVINRACLRHGLPWIFGGVRGFNGMATSFVPESFTCFECIIPDPERSDPDQLEPGQSNPGQGILGPTAGIIASIQAMEAVKLLVGMGSSLVNRLLHLSGLDMRITTSALAPNPDCRVCNPARAKRTRKNDHPA